MGMKKISEIIEEFNLSAKDNHNIDDVSMITNACCNVIEAKIKLSIIEDIKELRKENKLFEEMKIINANQVDLNNFLISKYMEKFEITEDELK
jgi:hypothetical protein